MGLYRVESRELYGMTIGCHIAIPASHQSNMESLVIAMVSTVATPTKDQGSNPSGLILAYICGATR